MYKFLYYLRVGKAFLIMTPNPEALKEKLDKFKYIRKKLCGKRSPKTHHNLGHRTSDKPGEIFANYISKGYSLWFHKELLKIKRKRPKPKSKKYEETIHRKGKKNHPYTYEKTKGLFSFIRG